LQKIYRDIDPYDTENILKYEWLNSRGAIARFDRNTIEIRIIDIQECPTADLAVVTAIVETLKNLISEKWISYEEQKLWDEDQLAEIFLDVIKFGEEAEINDLNYLKIFGFDCEKRCRAKDLWNHISRNIFEEDYFSNNEIGRALNLILNEGTLSTRIINFLDHDFSQANILSLYRKLSSLLSEGKMLSLNNR
jgi:carboxylate-amine ligase